MIIFDSLNCNIFFHIDPHFLPEAIFQKITSGILDTVKETLALQTSNQCNWMSAETKGAIEEKHTTRKQVGHKSPAYKAAKAKVKKLVEQDTLNQIEKI